jgi:Spy/CpxP family protein refolding chaperone
MTAKLRALMTPLMIALLALIGSVALIAAVGDTSDSLNHGGPRGEGRGMGHGPEKMMRGLDLTDEQKSAIEKLHEDFKAEHADEFAAMETLHEKMRALKESGADRDDFTALREEKKALHENMRADHEALRARMMEILTDEQKAKLAEKKEGRCGGHRRHHGDKERNTEPQTPGIN